MKCFQHSDVDAVGICTRCGKAGCRECFNEGAGSLVCTNCAGETLPIPHLQTDLSKSIGASEQIESETARSRIRWSWIITIVFAAIIFPVYLGMMMKTPDFNASIVVMLLLAALASFMFGYVVWSACWGIPTVWRWLLNLAKNIRGAQVSIDYLTLFALYIFFFWFPIIIGIPYGLLGGGVYQYLKHRRIASSATESIQAV